MRTRIKYQSIDEKVWNKKRELAMIYAHEKGCTLTSALARVEFRINYKRI